ncbi:MAG TPA: HAD-IA family hydrolase [Mycobacteriales bacterium]|nr:HAD-IA family hydrolase [Mycobacteriales bacterium]
MRPVDWVVLDLGETLVDETRSWAGWADWLGVPQLTFMGVLGAVIAERRHHLEAFAYFREGFDFSAERAVKHAAGLGWELDGSDLCPDALPALAALRARGYRLAVMANQPRESMPLLQSLPVDRVATSAEWGLWKPDPAFFARVCEEVGAEPVRIAYVGDRVDNDVLPAKQAGMLAVHLRRGPWGYLHATWPEAVEADLRLDGLAGLADALDATGS